MDKRTARYHALLSIAAVIRSGSWDVAYEIGSDEDGDKISEQIDAIADELERRAIALDERKPVQAVRS